MKNETVHPRNAKVQVAMRIVDKYHGEGAGQAAFEEFERMFVKKDVPDDIEEITIEGDAEQQLLNVIASTKMVGSKKDGSRMIQQGAVSVDGEKVTDFKAMVDFSEQRLIKVGKRKFLKVTVG